MSEDPGAIMRTAAGVLQGRSEMVGDMGSSAVRALLALCAVGGFIGQVGAETLVEHSAEATGIGSS